jgi:HD domain
MESHSKRLAQLPLVLFVTATMLLLPVAVLTAGQFAVGVTFPLYLTAALGAGLSMALGRVGLKLWLRNPRSKDVLFSDLMLWGWTQRVVQERRLANATRAFRFEKGTRRDRTSVDRQIATLKKLAVRLEAQDPYTHGHTRRVARHSYMIAKTMGLPREYALKVRTAAAVHDVGKMHVAADVLHKTGKLSDDEFDQIKQHSVYGAEMVAEAGADELTAIVRHHHERIDGKGYPDRLAGDQIPLGARIIAVADTFDAITSVRSYRDASPHLKAIEIIKKVKGSQLDPEATEAFLHYYDASKSRRFLALLASAPDKVLSWLGNLVRQAGASTAVTAVTAASVVVAAAGVMPPPRTGPVTQASVLNSVVVNDGADVSGSDDGGGSSDDGSADDSTSSDDDGGSKKDSRDKDDAASSDGSEGGGSGSGKDKDDSSDDGGSGGGGNGGGNSGSGGGGSDNGGGSGPDSGSGSDGGTDEPDPDDSGGSDPGPDPEPDPDPEPTPDDGGGSGSGGGDDGGLIGDVIDTVDDITGGLGL